MPQYRHLSTGETQKVPSTVKPVYKGTKGKEPCMSSYPLHCIYRLKLYTLFINRKNETALYRL